MANNRVLILRLISDLSSSELGSFVEPFFKQQGWAKPTTIQSLGWGPVLDGKDFVASFISPVAAENHLFDRVSLKLEVVKRSHS